jgi:hypothetical protein
MSENLKVFIKDNDLDKIHTEYFQTLQHAEYYVMNENSFMNKSLEIVSQLLEEDSKNYCKP